VEKYQFRSEVSVMKKLMILIAVFILVITACSPSSATTTLNDTQAATSEPAQIEPGIEQYLLGLDDMPEGFTVDRVELEQSDLGYTAISTFFRMNGGVPEVSIYSKLTVIPTGTTLDQLDTSWAGIATGTLDAGQGGFILVDDLEAPQTMTGIFLFQNVMGIVQIHNYIGGEDVLTEETITSLAQILSDRLPGPLPENGVITIASENVNLDTYREYLRDLDIGTANVSTQEFTRSDTFLPSDSVVCLYISASRDISDFTVAIYSDISNQYISSTHFLTGLSAGATISCVTTGGLNIGTYSLKFLIGDSLAASFPLTVSQ
jgi:hypothetical protein